MLYLITYQELIVIINGGKRNDSKDEKDLAFEDIDILESIGSDLCEGIRDLVYNLKEMRNDIEALKKHANIG